MDRTTAEYRLSVVRDNIRYHEQCVARYKVEEAQLVTEIQNERERRERLNHGGTIANGCNRDQSRV